MAAANNAKPLSCYGCWHVTTEGDCEGRTIRDLGVYEGYIDDIAFAIGGEAFYALRFEPAKLTQPKSKKSCDQVFVSVVYGTGTWTMKDTERVEWFKNMLAGRPVDVSIGTYYASVLLSKSKELRIAKIRQRALDKLSAEEKEVLGL